MMHGSLIPVPLALTDTDVHSSKFGLADTSENSSNRSSLPARGGELVTRERVFSTEHGDCGDAGEELRDGLARETASDED
jgi:hypothetical protein